MELMPYLCARDADAEPGEAEQLPAFGAVPAGDWRDGLPVIGGDRCTLRELTLEDAPSLWAHLTTAHAARFISTPPASVEGFEDFIRWAHRRRVEGRFACFGVVPAGETRAVGLFQIHVGETGPRTAQWGFALGAACWGTGIFLDGARHIVDFAFAHMGIRQLEARTVLQNERANRALYKVGAVREAVLPRSFPWRGERLDQVLWTITREGSRAA